jgi:hypothetical protein
MPTTRSAKSVIKLFLLPAWNEAQFHACSDRLVKAAKSITALNVDDEDDLIILFSEDAMVYGAGSKILIEVNLPEDLVTDNTIGQVTADAMFAVMQGLLPDAYVQCSVSAFSISQGYRATVRRGDAATGAA